MATAEHFDGSPWPVAGDNVEAWKVVVRESL
eukprot:CAMPEP_0118902934 /NCGR_PEP_ID=MMETSP1166-20130328/8002_1 /TAXON_ID=1104430 /ORGANISM="Chrysoreinhardia sp, Strain CCMP3193" /LENGTH=30 /DNA_ID= /DNA_START= /DNA_END= /DNA_ORIENTATION=